MFFKGQRHRTGRWPHSFRVLFLFLFETRGTTTDIFWFAICRRYYLDVFLSNTTPTSVFFLGPIREEYYRRRRVIKGHHRKSIPSLMRKTQGAEPAHNNLQPLYTLSGATFIKLQVMEINAYHQGQLCLYDMCDLCLI